MLRVCVTGGAGRIAYSLIPLLCDGSIFEDNLISLRLLDIPVEGCIAKLRGIKVSLP
jgi:hypothetical protein